MTGKATLVILPPWAILSTPSTAAPAGMGALFDGIERAS